jgi:hypothetical protein
MGWFWAGAALGAPVYTAGGGLAWPDGYRAWVFLSSGLDMSYSAAAVAGNSTFDNTFADPFSWQAFQRTGHWPDGTMLVLEVRGAQGLGSINRHGHFQTGNVLGLEVHLRDEKRFAGGWGFFDFGLSGPGRLLPHSAPCYACHEAHGAVDTTFVQFYPTLLPIARQFGTVKEAAP